MNSNSRFGYNPEVEWVVCVKKWTLFLLLTISDFLRASQFINPRRESFRGQEVIVFDFEPRPNFKARAALAATRNSTWTASPK